MKKIFFIAILLVFVSSAFPQTSMTALQYSMGFGIGDMRDYIPAASFRGFTIDYRKFVNSNVGVGVDIGWNVFYDELPPSEYTNNKRTFYGKQWRYSNHFPMLLAADYFFKPEEMIVPFAGLGIGTMYSLQNTDMGQYTFEKDAWHFALRPELGILIKSASGAGLKISSKYYYGFEAGDLPAQGYVTINVGFVFVQ